MWRTSSSTTLRPTKMKSTDWLRWNLRSYCKSPFTNILLLFNNDQSDVLILCGFQRRGSWVSIFLFLCPRVINIFMRFSIGLVVFVSRQQRGRGQGQQGLGQEYYLKWKCGDCCPNGLPLDLLARSTPELPSPKKTERIIRRENIESNPNVTITKRNHL